VFDNGISAEIDVGPTGTTKFPVIAKLPLCCRLSIIPLLPIKRDIIK
jgi:hypothetical protein